MPVEMHIKADTGSAGKMLRRMIRAGQNLRPVLEVIGETVLTSIQRNFEEGGRPGWKPLAQSTLKKKAGRGQILIGPEKRLLGGIHYDAGRSSVSWLTEPLVYAAIHQFGGRAGRGRKTTIPARPYMLFQDEDIGDINDFLVRHITAK